MWWLEAKAEAKAEAETEAQAAITLIPCKVQDTRCITDSSTTTCFLPSLQSFSC